MKTIAITIDESMVERIDQFVRNDPATWSSRSGFIREAAGEFLARLDRIEAEEMESRVFRENRDQLQKDAEALIEEQAAS